MFHTGLLAAAPNFTAVRPQTAWINGPAYNGMVSDLFGPGGQIRPGSAAPLPPNMYMGQFQAASGYANFAPAGQQQQMMLNGSYDFSHDMSGTLDGSKAQQQQDIMAMQQQMQQPQPQQHSPCLPQQQQQQQLPQFNSSMFPAMQMPGMGMPMNAPFQQDILGGIGGYPYAPMPQTTQHNAWHQEASAAGFTGGPPGMLPGGLLGCVDPAAAAAAAAAAAIAIAAAQHLPYGLLPSGLLGQAGPPGMPLVSQCGPASQMTSMMFPPALMGQQQIPGLPMPMANLPLPMQSQMAPQLPLQQHAAAQGLFGAAVPLPGRQLMQSTLVVSGRASPVGDVKKEKRKQSNRDSARRSRLRKLAESEQLGVRVSRLTTRQNSLQDSLLQLLQAADALQAHNALLQEGIQLMRSSRPVPEVLRRAEAAAAGAWGGCAEAVDAALVLDLEQEEYLSDAASGDEGLPEADEDRDVSEEPKQLAQAQAQPPQQQERLLPPPPPQQQQRVKCEQEPNGRQAHPGAAGVQCSGREAGALEEPPAATEQGRSGGAHEQMEALGVALTPSGVPGAVSASAVAEAGGDAGRAAPAALGAAVGAAPARHAAAHAGRSCAALGSPNVSHLLSMEPSMCPPAAASLNGSFGGGGEGLWHTGPPAMHVQHGSGARQQQQQQQQQQQWALHHQQLQQHQQQQHCVGEGWQGGQSTWMDGMLKAQPQAAVPGTGCSSQQQQQQQRMYGDGAAVQSRGVGSDDIGSGPGPGYGLQWSHPAAAWNTGNGCGPVELPARGAVGVAAAGEQEGCGAGACAAGGEGFWSAVCEGGEDSQLLLGVDMDEDGRSSGVSGQSLGLA